MIERLTLFEADDNGWDLAAQLFMTHRGGYDKTTTYYVGRVMETGLFLLSPERIGIITRLKQHFKGE